MMVKQILGEGRYAQSDSLRLQMIQVHYLFVSCVVCCRSQLQVQQVASELATDVMGAPVMQFSLCSRLSLHAPAARGL
jgi:hypothetical protein